MVIRAKIDKFVVVVVEMEWCLKNIFTQPKKTNENETWDKRTKIMV